MGSYGPAHVLTNLSACCVLIFIYFYNYFVNIPLICSRINNHIVVARKECCVYM